MKFVFPEIDCVFDTDCGIVNTLVIENQKLMYSLIDDIQKQLTGSDGRSVLSEGDKILSIDKKLELLDRFIPFDLNSKALISKITADLEKKAISDEWYSRTCEFIGIMQSLLSNLAFDYSCNIEFSKIGIGSVIKAYGIEICDDYDSLGEKIIDYFELVHEFIGKKLFVTVNLRSYISDKEAELFMQTALSHQFNVLMIENCEHKRLSFEKRLIVDADLCLIS
ncbi:MAG: type II-A CRISPR-associated protein Csn2 [Acutalibacteraceae bacterium]